MQYEVQKHKMQYPTKKMKGLFTLMFNMPFLQLLVEYNDYQIAVQGEGGNLLLRNLVIFPNRDGSYSMSAATSEQKLAPILEHVRILFMISLAN